MTKCQLCPARSWTKRWLLWTIVIGNPGNLMFPSEPWQQIMFSLGIFNISRCPLAFPGGSHGKESTFRAGDLGSILGSRRSPGEGNGNPLQYSCLKNSRQRILAGYSPWGLKESDTTEQLTLSYESWARVCPPSCMGRHTHLCRTVHCKQWVWACVCGPVPGRQEMLTVHQWAESLRS